MNLDDLIDEGMSVDVEAQWGAGFLAGRCVQAQPPWTWEQIAGSVVATSQSLLDMGTGEGGALLSLAPLPACTVATEEWWPTVPAARHTLLPAGVHLVVALGADDNHSRERTRPDQPFADDSFDAILNRHESFDAIDVHRMLRLGGTFVTQQVGGEDTASLRELLGLGRSEPWTLTDAMRQVLAGGLSVEDSGQAHPPTRFTDVAALIAYVRTIPWSIPELDPIAMRPVLAAVHQRCESQGSVSIDGHRFWLRATKPI